MATDMLSRARDLLPGAAREQERRDFLKEAADMGSERVADYARAEAYYEGDHKVQLTDREREYLSASGLPYAENYCETIVDAEVARLNVTGFGGDKDLAAFARKLWEQNQMDAGQIELFDGAVKLGDYFLLIDYEEGRLPTWSLNDPRNVKFVYDSGELMYAVKVWSTSRFSFSNPQGRKIHRMNIYWPDAIQKFFATDKDADRWTAFAENDGDGSTIPWTMDGKPDGEPIGIPGVHFANKPNAKQYGRSSLRGVIPQQDALNKSLIDHYWIMDAQGWPQQWGSGVKAESIKRHPGSLWTTESDQARFGQLDPADPEKSIASIESQIGRMASLSKTTLHEMLASGKLPSGETLKTSESGAIQKTRRFQIHGGDRFADAVKISSRIETAYGTLGAPLEGTLKTNWERAQTRQELDEANTAVLWVGLGVSRETALTRLGFDPEAEAKKRAAEEPLNSADGLLEKARQMQVSSTPPAGTGGDQPREGKTTKASGRTR